MGDGVPIEEWTGEFYYHGRLKLSDWAAAKSRLNRAIVYGDKDPKPDDLSMSRLNVG